LDAVRQALDDAQRTLIFQFAVDDAQYGGLAYIPIELRSIRGLRKILLDGARISYWPDWLPELDSLEEIQLTQCGLKEWPAPLFELRSLRIVNLNRNELAILPGAINNLTSLSQLTLSGNRINTFTNTACELQQLHELDLGGNDLENLPDKFRQLQNLRRLFLWGNRFTAIPGQLRGLSQLELLEFSATGIHARQRPAGRPDASRGSIARGPALVGANRNVERISRIPSWLAEGLPKLTELYLGGQDVTEVPANLNRMSSLRKLYLAGNSISVIPSEITQLSELEELDLRGNNIEVIPPTFGQLRGLTYLDLAENPLAVPPEILERVDQPQEVIDFLVRVETAEARPLNEAKLLVVGEAAVGKTSLISRLVSNTFNADQVKTEGIDVTKWVLPQDAGSITLNMWDFGGQEIMHATHQFFLTKRSIYLLVIDSRQDEDQNRIEYWLKIIQSFSDNSPVIIVGNKCDQNGLDLDQRGLRKKYGNIVDVVTTSCLTGAGLDDLRGAISYTLGRLQHVTDELPESYFKVKEHLEALDANYLTYQEYKQLCIRYGVRSQASQELLVGFLHDLGTVLCFRDDPRLADTHILNPRWVTGGVYRLLNSHLAAQSKGLLRWDDVYSILDSDGYPSDRRVLVIDMMKRFELCYESEGTFLIPDLLAKDEPDTGEWDNALHFEVKYDVLPSSIICRLIVRMHELISKGTVWRTGMVLIIDRNRALIRGDREDSLLSIDISGPDAGRRGMLTAIRTELHAISRTVPGLHVEERVPVPGREGIFVPYRHLIDLEDAGRETVVPQGTVDDFSIKALLAGVESPDNRTRIASIERVPETTPPPTREIADTAGPWSARQAVALGGFLLFGVVVILGASVAAYMEIGATVALILGLSLAVAVSVGLFILRSSGRISDDTFLGGLKTAVASAESGGKGDGPQQGNDSS
jgi:internalin A